MQHGSGIFDTLTNLFTRKPTPIPIPIVKSPIIETDSKPTIIHTSNKLESTKQIWLMLIIYSQKLIDDFNLPKQAVEGRTYNISQVAIKIRNIQLQITNKGLNVTGEISQVRNDELRSNLLNKEYNLHNFLYNNIESIIYKPDEDVKNSIEELFREYLTMKQITNINPLMYDRTLYLQKTHELLGSKYYKIHFSINIEYWKETFDFLIDYYKNNKGTISKFKFVFSKLSHYKDIEDDNLNDYTHNFDFGAGIANFVIYPIENDTSIIFSLINNLVDEWMTKGLDGAAGRENNNLFFNERLTKAIYIGYGSDTNSKAGAYIHNRKNNNKIWLNYVNTYNINSQPVQFKNTPELKEEITNRCNKKLTKRQKGNIDTCLKKKYNLRPEDLCSTQDLDLEKDDIDLRDIKLKRKYSVNDNKHQYRNVTLADNWIINDDSTDTKSYNNEHTEYGKRCYN